MRGELPETPTTRVDRLRSEARVLRAVEALPPGRYVLAVSGGRDSMVLLDSFLRVRRDAVNVATFDHGTGEAASRAVQLTQREGSRRGVEVVSERREDARPSDGEQAWRRARWRFLHRVARDAKALVVTAHTRDDQIETIVMRLLRDAVRTSARGLAAMYAASHVHPVERPLLGISRADTTDYASLRDVRFVNDPTNASRRHLRNRVRHDLLGALESARPGICGDLLDLSCRAAAWRCGLDIIVDTLGAERLREGVLVVPAEAMLRFDAVALGIIWPALAERAGVVLDWRGTERLVAFTHGAKPLRGIPLSGGATVSRTASTFVVRAFAEPDPLY